MDRAVLHCAHWRSVSHHAAVVGGVPARRRLPHYREGNCCTSCCVHLYCAVPISFAQAALGTEITVPTLDGECVVKIPEGTQPGTTFRVKNKGVPVLNAHGRGDLHVEIKVHTPSKLSKRQRELLQELQATTSVENKPVSRSLLNKMKDMFQ